MTTPGQTPVLLSLPTLTPSLAVEILPHGLTVHNIYVQTDGQTHDLVIGPEDPADFLDKNHKYHNTIVGRYANRIPVGTYELARNGVTSLFTAQPNQNPKVSLHGGPTGFDNVDWEVLHPSQATLFSDEEKATLAAIPTSVLFSYTSPDGDQGFPGTILTEVLVGLLEASQTSTPLAKGEFSLGSIVFIYRAKLLDEKPVVTPINLTQHWGFNLDASIHDDTSEKTVKNQKLTIKAGHTVALDGYALSAGRLDNVKGTKHHHESKLIGDGFPESGYDSFYVFDSTDTPSPVRLQLSDLPSLNLVQDLTNPKGTTSEPLVQLESEKSGIKLSFYSNQSGVQFYTANFVTKDGARKKIHGGKGKVGENDGYGPGTAAFLEFHEPLAAWLHPETAPRGFDTLLSTGELYNNFVKVDVTHKIVKRV